jgi:pimeloyl-ACP methyl ester carboxylesterase
MPILRVAGEQVHYVQRRSAPESQSPVVFVHGAGGTHQHWLYQVRDPLDLNSLDPSFPPPSTFAVDLPGHGRSEGPGRDSISAYGDWLVSFFDAAGLEQAVLVGHSMGGGIALDMALRYPARVVGLGLVATGARLRVASGIFEGILQDKEAAVDLICLWAFGPEAPEEMARLGRRQMGATPTQVLYDDFVACDAFDVMDRLAQISVPTVVVCGTQDRLTPVKYSIYLRDCIAGATLHLIEGAGHMVMIENPPAVVRALAGLVARV